MIHGESYKPIVAEAARNAIGEENVYERVFVAHPLLDADDPTRIAGVVGFSVRDYKVIIFKAKAVISAGGGATGVYRPRAQGEGLGRIWYAPWNTGSAYAMQIRAGAKMTQMEHRLVVARFKDGYGPVGMWFLLFKCQSKNSLGEIIEQTRAHELEEWAPYGTAKPVPTPLRNHLMLNDIKDGRGPHYMMTDEALQRMFVEAQHDPKKIAEIESDAWEDFLDMTMSQAHIWASQNIDPAKTPSELILTEPYLMGSHASATGAWCSGPEDAAPEGYFWGYNRMTTVKGLFAAGDACGASAHKFSSGSYTEGRLAGKAAVQYVIDNTDVRHDEGAVSDTIREIYRPFNVFGEHQHETSRPELNAHYILPKMALHRIQKIMDEYGGGPGNYYMTNGPTLERGLELMQMFREDAQNLAARDLHDLLRCWEVWDRIDSAEACLRHMLFREETRWPGYYYRGDFPKLDEENWKVFVNSRRDPKSGEWELEKVPFATKIS
jgi:adenylylsulfate reductase subunit A